MKLTIVDDNNGRWNTICEWLNENMTCRTAVTHIYYSQDLTKIDLYFRHEEDAVVFKLRFGL